MNNEKSVVFAINNMQKQNLAENHLKKLNNYLIMKQTLRKKILIDWLIKILKRKTINLFHDICIHTRC